MSAIIALVLGAAAVVAIGSPAVGFAFGSAALATGLLAREKLRHNQQLVGVAPSVLGVTLGAIALFFTPAPVLLTFSAYLQNLVTGF
jgi:hypothetical protein